MSVGCLLALPLTPTACRSWGNRSTSAQQRKAQMPN
jgi:hypothetical protein